MYKKLLIWLIVASIFLDDYLVGGNSKAARASMPFDVYYYYFFFLLIILYYIRKFKSIIPYPRYFLIGISIFYIGSVFGAANYGLFGFSMFKQMLGILFSAGAYYAAIRIEEFNIKKLFIKYTQLAVIVAGIGVVQEVLYMKGIHGIFANVKKVSIGFYRVYSIMGEPYFLAVALAPALFYFINKLAGSKTFRNINFYNLISFGTIFLCYLFTFSTGGLIGLAVMFLLTAYNVLKKKVFVVLPLAALYVVSNPEKFEFDFDEVQVRIEDTFAGMMQGGEINKSQLSEMNSSSFALISNLIIAQRTISFSPVFGCGVGNHEHVSNAVFETLFGEDFLIRFGNFNAKDANSLFVRVMSEGGYLGLLLLFFTYLRPFVFRRGMDNPKIAFYTIINQAAFIMFTIRMVRTGNYISQGFMFFLFLYIISYQQIKKGLAEAKALEPVSES